MNIVEILEKCPSGTKLYTPIVGDVEYQYCNGLNSSIVCRSSTTGDFVAFTSDGRVFADEPDGECLLFPSKDNHDWTTFTPTYPKTWEEFCKTHPIREGEYYIANESDICVETGTGNPRRGSSDRNIIASKELAEAFLALMQLIQLRDCYNNGWKPNWEETWEVKYCIISNSQCLKKDSYRTISHILAFKTEELRDQFLENFSELIEIAKPLI